MWGDHAVVQAPQIVVGGQRLGLGDIQAGAAQVAVGKCLRERLRIDERPAPHIDHHRAIRHFPDGLRVDHVAGFLGERGDEDEVVVVGPDIVGKRHGVIRAFDGVAGAVHRSDLHAEGLKEPDQRFADAACTDDRELLVVEEVLLLLEQLRIVPLAVHGLHAVLHREQQREGGLGDGVVVQPAGVGETHAVCRVLGKDILQVLHARVLDLHDLDGIGQLVREVARAAAEEDHVRVVLEGHMLVALRLQRGNRLVFGLGQKRELHARPD